MSVLDAVYCIDTLMSVLDAVYCIDKLMIVLRDVNCRFTNEFTGSCVLYV